MYELQFWFGLKALHAESVGPASITAESGERFIRADGSAVEKRRNFRVVIFPVDVCAFSKRPDARRVHGSAVKAQSMFKRGLSIDERKPIQIFVIGVTAQMLTKSRRPVETETVFQT